MKKITVDIGIPAYNEASCIGNILSQLTFQNSIGYKLHKVTVYCDDCTDNTAEIASKFIKKLPLEIINGKKRVGKSGGINRIFKVSTGDVLICLDADIDLASNSTIMQIVSQFNSKNVGLVGGNIYPKNPNNFIQKIIYERSIFWKEVTEKINNGNTINNNVGRIYALTKKVYKNIHIPNGIGADDDFIFLTVRKLKMQFAYAKDAIVFYKTPNNIYDYLKQFSRFKNSEKKIIRIFKDIAFREYYIDPKIKYYAYLKYLVSKPSKLFYLLVSQILLLIGGILMKNEGQGSSWEPAMSTKK